MRKLVFCKSRCPTVRIPRCGFVIMVCILLGMQFAARSALAQDVLDRPIELDIPEHTSLEDALIAWGGKAGLVVMMNTTTVDGQTSSGLHGTLSARKALATLLRGSGLSYTEKGNSVCIVRSNTLVRSTLRDDDMPLPLGRSDSDSLESDSKESLNSKDLQTVVVSAEKREENLHDVPIPLSVISTESLAETNEVRMSEYYMDVPGLSVAPAGGATDTLSIRGVTTGNYTAATVGIMIDDIPFGTTGSQQIPDLDPGDLARIEVLRGPQGTLYGISSMGGLVKFVTKDPPSDHVEGRLEAGTESVDNGSDLGYTLRGSVGGPLAGNWSGRASAFVRRDAGYIDNPLLGIEGINQAYAEGGRLAALWRPDDNFSLRLSALYEDIRSDSPSYVLVGHGLGDLQQNYGRGVGPYNRGTQAYSAIFKAKFGSLDFSSDTGYNVSAIHNVDDGTFFYGGLGPAVFGVPNATTAPLVTYDRGTNFTQEFRLNFPIGRSVDGLVGLFYSHQHSLYVQSLLASDPEAGTVYGLGYYAPITTTLSEYAAFANMTYHPTDNFDIQFGVRRSEIKSSTPDYATTGPYIPPLYGAGTASPVITPGFSFKNGPLTYLITPRYKISPDVMLYLRLSSGYRSGGSNAGIPGVPPEYGPDKTKDYEMGVKADFFSHQLSVDTSIYYIDWTDIQVSLQAPNTYTYIGNAGRAKSEGLEMSLSATPMKGLQISTWGTWTEAEVTELPANLGPGDPLTGSVGQMLPWSSRFSGHVSVTEEFVLTDTLNAYVGGTVSYLGDRRDIFTGLRERTDLPAYAKADFRVGLRHNSWTENFYVNNATNRRGAISGGNAPLNPNPPHPTYYIQPRTIGLSISRQF
jgi:iron complex outermembrane recepter protein